MRYSQTFLSLLALATTTTVRASLIGEEIGTFISAEPPSGVLERRDVSHTVPTSVSKPGVWNGCTYTVDGPSSGIFYNYTSRIHVNTSGWTHAAFDKTAPHGGFFVKTQQPDSGLGTFDASRVIIQSNGNLLLQQWPSPLTAYTGKWGNGSVNNYYTLPSAEMSTNWSDIMFGSVRTVAKGDMNPGGIYGFFFYDNKKGDLAREADIEVRTSYDKMLCYTAQNTNGQNGPFIS